MNKILEDLNDKQLEAVEHLEGPLLILAGAGSGKTRTLTHRIANLIQHGVYPSRILAVSFTNKAAGEMRIRLWKLLNGTDDIPPRNFMPFMGTFHGICVRILREESAAIRLPRDFIIYDTDDQIALIKRILKTLDFNTDKSLKPRSIQSIISAEKNHGGTPKSYTAKAYYDNQFRIAQVFNAYEEEKARNGALDFDDLLLKTLQLFQENPSIREKWREKFEYILIDEYQDTNFVQYQLVKALVNSRQNIAVVGDDWQSIYSWRGADFTNILNFTKDFPEAFVVKLEQNYRSTGQILEASQKVISHNKTRTDKVLFTKADRGEPVVIEALADDKAEAFEVLSNIRGTIDLLDDVSVADLGECKQHIQNLPLG